MNYDLRTATDIYAMAKVQQWFAAIPNIPPKVRMQCNLVLVEIFTNVVCYAHADLPEDTPIDLLVITDNQGLELHIWDFGAPFDLRREVEHQRDRHEKALENLDDLPTGGRGLMITDSIADQLEYMRLPDGRNHFRMRKNFSPSLDADAAQPTEHT
ncbi:MAG: ATP-binding protein [Oscillatoriales cyanobacterium SM2_2_1]|nr:ATP-binding protein [Oscillatoriales cyanobacterium SM2_2_1]